MTEPNTNTNNNPNTNDNPPLLSVKTVGDGYLIAQYDRNMLTFDNVSLGRCRSVVLDAETRRVYSISPAKSMNCDLFLQRHPDLDNASDFVMNTTVEGTMINVFFNSRESRWEIATRGAISGKYWFSRTEYFEDKPKPKQKTFVDMMMDALKIEETPYQPWYHHPLFEQVDRNYSYSFVLQHPANHIVYTFGEPRLYLVAMYRLPSTEGITWNDLTGNDDTFWSGVEYIAPDSELAVSALRPFHDAGVLYTPKALDVAHWREHRKVLDQNTYPMGLMITHIPTGERLKLENPHYLRLKELRGNNPNLQYQFFALLRLGKTREFVNVFPQYRKTFARFFEQYVDFLHRVHRAYIDHYVRKSPDIIPKYLFVHVVRIHHSKYLASIATPKPYVTYQTVREYFEEMEPGQLLYLLSK